MASTLIFANAFHVATTHISWFSSFQRAFPFFRATFYRWMQVWPEVCPDITHAPKVLAVGDLHVENFGSWRDVLRVVAIADFRGGSIAREVKALSPSAVSWATGRSNLEIQYAKIIDLAVRCPDPFVHVRGRWVGRRLAPYGSRIELDVLPAIRDELRLLSAMGWETANIHSGSRKPIGDLKKHLRKLKADWLASAAKEMAKAVTHDWNDCRRT